MPETNEFLGDESCFLTKGNPSARPASPAAAKAMISAIKSSVLKNRHRDFTRYLALPINFFTLVETEPWDRTRRPGGWRKTDQPTDDIPCFARNNHKA